MLKNIKIKNPSILLLGISYKKNVDDDRVSTFEIMRLLKEKNVKFQYNDPYFPILRKGRNFKFSKKSIFLNKKNLKIWCNSCCYRSWFLRLQIYLKIQNKFHDAQVYLKFWLPKYFILLIQKIHLMILRIN